MSYGAIQETRSPGESIFNSMPEEDLEPFRGPGQGLVQRAGGPESWGPDRPRAWPIFAHGA